MVIITKDNNDDNNDTYGDNLRVRNLVTDWNRNECRINKVVRKY